MAIVVTFFISTRLAIEKEGNDNCCRLLHVYNTTLTEKDNGALPSSSSSQTQ